MLHHGGENAKEENEERPIAKTDKLYINNSLSHRDFYARHTIVAGRRHVFGSSGRPCVRYTYSARSDILRERILQKFGAADICGVIAEKVFKVMESKVKVTEAFAGGGTLIDSLPSKTVLVLFNPETRAARDNLICVKHCGRGFRARYGAVYKHTEIEIERCAICQSHMYSMDYQCRYCIKYGAIFMIR